MDINIEGLTAHPFAGQEDFPQMAALLQTIASLDHSVPWTTSEQIESDYRHLENCDPATDLFLVRDGSGKLIAFTRLFWVINDEGCQVFKFAFNIDPEWRSLELNQAMLQWVHARTAVITKEVSHPGRRLLLPIVRNILTETACIAALEAQGYRAVRFINQMSRDLNEPIHLLPLPAGLELRPVAQGQYRALTLATDEAFRDHWGHVSFSDENFQQWVASPEFKPELWKVAWDGDQIASGILNFFDEDANRQLNTRTGWTDPIFTRRPWRKRGLARALIMLSLEMFKNMGFTEAMLYVDTQNPGGAFGLYESCGYKSLLRSAIYEKEVPDAE
jgi:GNAT superfamily N-acetyltransferase